MEYEIVGTHDVKCKQFPAVSSWEHVPCEDAVMSLSLVDRLDNSSCTLGFVAHLWVSELFTSCKCEGVHDVIATGRFLFAHWSPISEFGVVNRTMAEVVGSRGAEGYVTLALLSRHVDVGVVGGLGHISKFPSAACATVRGFNSFSEPRPALSRDVV